MAVTLLCGIFVGVVALAINDRKKDREFERKLKGRDGK